MKIRHFIFQLCLLGLYSASIAAAQISIGGVTASPSSASPGSSATFAVTVNNNGNAVNQVYLLINFWLDGTNSCYFSYVPGSDSLYMMADSGSSWMDPVSISSASTLANSQCQASSASYSMNSGTTTFNVTLAFHQNYTGTKVLWAAATGSGGSGGASGWQPGGVFNVTGPSPNLGVSGVAPATGSGPGGTYSYTLVDTNGWQDLNIVDVLINNGLDGAGACYVALIVSGSSFTLKLVDDAGHAGGPFAGSISLPGSGTMSNSQCTVLGSGSSVVVNGNLLTLTVTASFNSSFAGLRIDYAAGQSQSLGTEGWEAVGSWTVTPSGVSPTVELTDLTQVSGYYYAGDSFHVRITGAPNQTVLASLDGRSPGPIGVTDGSGTALISGTWQGSDAGAHYEVFLVGGRAATPDLLFSVLPSTYAGGPPSIPGSYTATIPDAQCNDITGNWIATDSVNQVSEWDLTQAGNSISGNIYYSNGSSCGIVTYNASGSSNSNQFTISGSQPYLYDYCGYPLATSVTQSVNLSGRSCSSGSGQWGSNLGNQSGSVIWKPKTSQNSISSRTTAHYRIEYASYIPVDNLVGPRPCAFTPIDIVMSVPLRYKGDAYRGTYRTAQSVVFLPGANRSYNFFANAGPTRNYGFGSPSQGGVLDSTPSTADIYGGPYNGMDEDNKADDCYLWNAAGHADTADMQNVTYNFNPANHSGAVVFRGSGKNPLENPELTPAISWNLQVTIDETNSSAPKASVSGSHTCYPAHNIKVNGTVVYDSQRDLGVPAYNNAVYLGLCLSQSFPLVNVNIAPTNVALQ